MSDAPRVLVIQARYYIDIADQLLAGAKAELAKAGASVEVIDVPGALEMPAALAMALDHEPGFDAFVLLGCVIRGETSHYDIVVNESARGVMALITRHRLAVGFGILTVENRDQAVERARADRLDKGGMAAQAALAMLSVREALRS